MAKYRAIRKSYGFRGQVWETGDVAEDVQASEKIPEHFELIKPGDSDEVLADKSFTPPEATTLSEIQDNETRPKSKRK